MPDAGLKIALIHEVFHDAEGPRRLGSMLEAARQAGAELAFLPELPLDPWVPASKTPRDEDAESPGGRRHELFGSAARRAGMGLVGGAITLDPDSRRRHNRALVFDASGRLVASYDKLHVPYEEGFWEAAHYEAGDAAPARIDAFGMPIGLQICSDLFRPEGCHVLGALGAEAILAPRATPGASYQRWRAIISANAIASCAYVVSANRPRPEADVSIGGPSLVAAPDGRVIVESTEPVKIVTLERDEVAQARHAYPGYLPVRWDAYARFWRGVGNKER